jgi:hypothetical protein
MEVTLVSLTYLSEPKELQTPQSTVFTTQKLLALLVKFGVLKGISELVYKERCWFSFYSLNHSSQ